MGKIQHLLLGYVDGLANDVLIKQLKTLTPSSKKLLEELDSTYVSFILNALPEKIIKNNEEGTRKTVDDFVMYGEHGEEHFELGWERTGEGFHDWKKGFIPAEIVEVSDNLTIKRIRTDAIYGPPALDKEAINKILTSSTLFPVEDAIANFESMDEVTQLVKDVKLHGKKSEGASPDPYGEWGDKSSDKHFSRLFFNGIGAALLEQQIADSTRPELGPIEIDMDFMVDLPLREGFRPYGAKVYFDLDQKCTGIYDSAKRKLFVPGDEGWEKAKFVARASAFTLLTAREHLMQSHMIVANYVSLSSIKHLPPSHPIRRLINLFTFRTNYVNDSAFSTLVPENSILHHGTAFEFKGLQTIFENSFSNSNAFEPFPKVNMRPELLEMSKNGKLPYHKEGVEYYNIAEKLVKEWLGMEEKAATDEYAQAFYNEIRQSTENQKYKLPEFKGADSIVDVLSQFIFRVTCYHEIIGVVVQYVNDPFAYTLRLQENEDGELMVQADVQSFLLSMAIVATTGLTVPPLMDPYKGYMGRDGAPMWEKTVWNDFQAALDKQSKALDSAESKRTVEYLFSNPKKFESSISV